MNDKKTIAVTGKITIPDFQILKEKIKDRPELNQSRVVSTAVHNFLHPEIENTGKQRIINEMIAENNRLKEKVNKLSEDIANQPAKGPDPKLQETIQALTAENETLKADNEQLKNQPKTLKLSKNQLLINVPPTLQPFLTEVSNRETNRTGHKVTPDMVLLNLFWGQVSKGPGDHLPMTFSPAEIRRRLEIVKQNQKQAE